MINLQATRDGFGQAILELGKTDPDVVALCADVEISTRVKNFKDRYPDRFFEVGVAEQNMVGMAAGMALGGKIPFAVSYAAFVPCRTYDQIRISVAYNNVNVKLVGSHAGLTTGRDGATHQMLEDIALMRALPNMTVVVPADAEEARKATLALARHHGPAYLRLGREPMPAVTERNSHFALGQAEVLRRGEDATIVACGIMVNEALLAADELSGKNIEVTVVNCHTVKPLDKVTLTRIIDRTKVVLTVEEAQINGGLGGAVAELLGETTPRPLKRIGVEDKFGQSGAPLELLKAYGLTSHHITEAVVRLLKVK
jgi:transketolase